MNPLSVCYRRICSVIHHRRNGKVNEKTPCNYGKIFNFKKKILMEEIFIHLYVGCYYAILHFFASLN